MYPGEGDYSVATPPGVCAEWGERRREAGWGGGDAPGEGHFLGGDVDGDGGGVDEVVVAAVDGAEGAVGLGFEPGHFVHAAAVAFDVFAVAD